MYPRVSATASGKTINVNVTDKQTYSENGFATWYPMAAVTEDGKTFNFKNLATILRLPLTGNATIGSVKIETVGGEPLAGAAIIDFSGETPVIKAAEGASTSVTLDCTKSYPILDESEPTHFNFILFPGTYSQGFKFTITESNGTVTTVSTAATEITLTAGTFKDFDSPLKIATPQGWNLFGTITRNSWIELTDAHGIHYAADVSVSGDERTFKIRYGADEEYGLGMTGTINDVPLMTSYTLYRSEDAGYNNGYLAVPMSDNYSGTYDFYFDYYPHNIIITKSGEVPFYVMGTNNMDENQNWLGTRMELDKTNGYIALKNVYFPSDKKGGPRFKILFGTDWNNNPYHIGAIGDTNVQINSKITVGKENPGDISLPGNGPYDIYLDFYRPSYDGRDNEKIMSIWIMESGKVPGEN